MAAPPRRRPPASVTAAAPLLLALLPLPTRGSSFQTLPFPLSRPSNTCKNTQGDGGSTVSRTDAIADAAWRSVSEGAWDGAQLWAPLEPVPPPWPGRALTHVLLLGDSLDRYAVEDGCAAWGAHVSPWADDVFPYLAKRGTSGSRMCSPAWGSLAFLHMYGAPPHGPYYRGHVSNAGNPFADTALRIPRALQRYTELFGRAPDAVVYQSSLWDAARCSTNATCAGAGWREFLRAHGEHVAANVAAVRAGLPPGTPVALRTSPSNPTNNGMGIAALNAVARAVARRTRAPLLDWAAAFASAHDPATVFRDGAAGWHPAALYSAAFIQAVVRAARAVPGRDAHVLVAPSPSPSVGATAREGEGGAGGAPGRALARDGGDVTMYVRPVEASAGDFGLGAGRV
jgi:hypothetical protein